MIALGFRALSGLPEVCFLAPKPGGSQTPVTSATWDLPTSSDHAHTCGMQSHRHTCIHINKNKLDFKNDYCNYVVLKENISLTENKAIKKEEGCYRTEKQHTKWDVFDLSR